MKILIISSNIGRTAPGIVFERIILGMSSKNEVDVLTSDYDPSVELSKVSNKFVCKKMYIHPRLTRLLQLLFGVNLFDCIWALKSIRSINKTKFKEYDLVFCLVSFGHYSSLISGVYCSKKYKKKLVVYSVDALPPPVGWLDYGLYYKSLQKMISKYLSKADAFFSSNHQMLEYQLKQFVNKKNLIKGVIYTPSLGEFQELSRIDQDINCFLYTGGIYGLRKADYLLKAFEKIVDIYPNSKLVFVGSKLPKEVLDNLKSETLQKIELVPFTIDLSVYYKAATALIDIDADTENDVFLSSKITNYLLINRFIISETGFNSPSSKLFKNINSIIQCDHDSKQIFQAMKFAIKSEKIIDFNDRKDVIELFKLENIINQLNRDLLFLIKS